MNQSNRSFAQIAPGDAASLSRIVGRDGTELFAAVTGDANPVHFDPALAVPDAPGQLAPHAMWSAALVAAVLATELPGPGTTLLRQECAFLRPVEPGQCITATVTVRQKLEAEGQLLFDTRCVNQDGEEVLRGTAAVLPPAQPAEWPCAEEGEEPRRRHGRFRSIVEEARAGAPILTAIVHPCSAAAILAALEIRDEGLVEPLLVGPEAKIRAAAEAAGASLEGLRIENADHSHAAAARAVEMAASGQVRALMKGSLHSDELLGAVVAAGSGLRTERRISHVYVMDVPAYAKPLVVTDAAINLAPTLEQKRDICQNAIDLLHSMGIEQPQVAVLAAVETVNPHMPSTLDAAALTVMAARGQITGAMVDGPLAFDNAISLAAARTKGIASPVAGHADILLVPDLEAGNMLAKQLIYFAGADAAGLVLGARVPIILTSRADSLKTRVASAALAKLVAMRRAGVKA